jgi:hypothetical protein
MSLRPGYNVVTDKVEDTESEYSALEFFRLLAHGENVPSRTTVVGLENLLYNTTERERDEAVGMLRDILRETQSLGSMNAIQFLVDGQIFHDDRFRIRIQRSGEPVHLNVGEMFVEEPQRLNASHAVARK